jgi:hypothetical protein
MWQLLERAIDAVDIVADVVHTASHARFYAPLLLGIVIALVLWDRMPQSDTRDLLQLGAVVLGLIIGILWDWWAGK